MISLFFVGTKRGVLVFFFPEELILAWYFLLEVGIIVNHIADSNVFIGGNKLGS